MNPIKSNPISDTSYIIGNLLDAGYKVSNADVDDKFYDFRDGHLQYLYQIAHGHRVTLRFATADSIASYYIVIYPAKPYGEHVADMRGDPRFCKTVLALLEE
jgi:hypothetical protein